jgi:hypothetical protein
MTRQEEDGMTSSANAITRLVDDLNARSRDELFEIFENADAPEIESFDGELSGYGAAYLPNLEAFYIDAGLGRWLGKGYKLQSHGVWEGHGYNMWGRGDDVIRRMRFGFRRHSSVVDGRPCILMRYAAFENDFGVLDLTDEIRKVDEHVYLGLATTREPSPLCPEAGGLNGRSVASTFLLVGPSQPWLGPDDPSTEPAA